MLTSTKYRLTLLMALGILLFNKAQAQNNPVASDRIMASLMPTTHLNRVVAPEENAHFYDDTCKDLKQSLAWMQEANAVAPKYWNLYTEARIQLRLKNYTAALSAATQAKHLAQTASPANPAYARLSEEVAREASLYSPAPELASAK